MQSKGDHKQFFPQQSIPKQVFPKQARLLTAADYRRVFDKAVRSSDKYFTVLARPNGLPHARLGMAFSKKRVKHAVARNRLKRVTRESFRHSFRHDTASRGDRRAAKLATDTVGADFVVLAGPHCQQADNRQLFESLQQHWQKLSKQCEKFS